MTSLLAVPVSVLLGVALGVLSGQVLLLIFSKFKMRGIVKVLSLIAVSLLLVAFENLISKIPMSGMLAVIVLGTTILRQKPKISEEFDVSLNKIWTVAQLILFVMVGANVDIISIKSIILYTILLLILTSILPTIGVFVSLHKTKLNNKEKLFSSLAYFPKATVQAAMGAVPLSIGMETGRIILNVAIISILVFAPLGAILIDKLYPILLEKNDFETR